MNSTLSARIALRDGHQCVYCGATEREIPAQPGSQRRSVWEMDHVTPESWGGRTEGANLALACWCCNREKSACNLKVYMVLLQEKHGYTALQTRAIAARVRAALKRALPEL